MLSHVVYINGTRYKSKAAWIRTIIGEANNRYLLQELTRALDAGEPLVYRGRLYIPSLTPPRAHHVAASEPPKAPERRLLARDHATIGLHQDRGEHYAEACR
jgi:hypothetical protein